VTAWSCGNRTHAKKLRAAKVKIKQAKKQESAKSVGPKQAAATSGAVSVKK
jgi:hypothetical protein